VIVQGTSTTESVYVLLPRLLAGEGPNVKLIQAVSWELFRLQPPSYRDAVLPHSDWLDSTVITNGSRRGMHDGLPHKTAERYAMSSDWDDRWRTGGSVEELKLEAKIDPAFPLDRHHEVRRRARAAPRGAALLGRCARVTPFFRTTSVLSVQSELPKFNWHGEKLPGRHARLASATETRHRSSS
jgi:hypothetical protein